MGRTDSAKVCFRQALEESVQKVLIDLDKLSQVKEDLGRLVWCENGFLVAQGQGMDNVLDHRL
jgi:hypothetical protein